MEVRRILEESFQDCMKPCHRRLGKCLRLRSHCAMPNSDFLFNVTFLRLCRKRGMLKRGSTVCNVNLNTHIQNWNSKLTYSVNLALDSSGGLVEGGNLQFNF